MSEKRLPAKSPRAKKHGGARLARKRILVVDDHPLMRDGLCEIIRKAPDLEICAAVGSPAEVLTLLDKIVPDLLLLDLNMPGRSGLEFIKDVLAPHPGLPILVFSMHDEGIYAERALRAGALGYLMKDAGGEKLLGAIRRVLSGQIYVSKKMSKHFLDALTGRKPRLTQSPLEKLSDREFEVFRLIGQGATTGRIAAQLNLSPKTVAAHRGNIKEKLDLQAVSEVLLYAVRWVETQDARRPAVGFIGP